MVMIIGYGNDYWLLLQKLNVYIAYITILTYNRTQ
jgi:hypothetical protein